MPTVRANGIDIYYEESGRPEDRALLLVNGFTSQMTSWDDRLIELLVDNRFRVIRYDNRDVGLSSKTEGPLPAMVPSASGLPELDAAPPYTLSDMAGDGMALLGELGVEQGHVAGVSMGGMIVQHMGFGHPERVLTMTSIMSTTGDRSVGQAAPEALAALLTPPPEDREAYIDHMTSTSRIISGPHFDEGRARERATVAYDRCFHPRGAAFQMAAVLCDGDRTARLAGVTCPTLVVHGRVDPLVHVSGGEATARAIAGAELLILDEMGHDLPNPLLPDIVAAIAKLAARV